MFYAPQTMAKLDYYNKRIANALGSISYRNVYLHEALKGHFSVNATKSAEGVGLCGVRHATYLCTA